MYKGTVGSSCKIIGFPGTSHDDDDVGIWSSSRHSSNSVETIACEEFLVIPLTNIDHCCFLEKLLVFEEELLLLYFNISTLRLISNWGRVNNGYGDTKFIRVGGTLLRAVLVLNRHSEEFIIFDIWIHYYFFCVYQALDKKYGIIECKVVDNLLSVVFGPRTTITFISGAEIARLKYCKLDNCPSNPPF